MITDHRFPYQSRSTFQDHGQQTLPNHRRIVVPAYDGHVVPLEIPTDIDPNWMVLSASSDALDDCDAAHYPAIEDWTGVSSDPTTSDNDEDLYHDFLPARRELHRSLAAFDVQWQPNSDLQSTWEEYDIAHLSFQPPHMDLYLPESEIECLEIPLDNEPKDESRKNLDTYQTTLGVSPSSSSSLDVHIDGVSTRDFQYLCHSPGLPDLSVNTEYADTPLLPDLNVPEFNIFGPNPPMKDFDLFPGTTSTFQDLFKCDKLGCGKEFSKRHQYK